MWKLVGALNIEQSAIYIFGIILRWIKELNASDYLTMLLFPTEHVPYTDHLCVFKTVFPVKMWQAP